ncbi:MAG: tetratricopeptide repeat protein [Cyclobacteriaceae bacterium]|nr:tetratricopeptide repeat protein [Cyclobacteriaceae bacterium]
MRFIYSLILSSTLLISCFSSDELRTGDTLFNQGDYKGALEAYNTYISMHPNDMRALYHRGKTYEALEDMEMAMADYKMVYKMEPENNKVKLSLANNSYYRDKDFEKAIYYLNEIITLDNENVEALILRGKSYQKLGDIQESLNDYNNAISHNPEAGEAYLSRGSLYLIAKQKSKACNDFKLALSLGVESAGEVLQKYCK